MLLCCAGVGMRLHAQPLNKGRIAILGDSIAYAGPWANEVENALKADKKFAAYGVTQEDDPLSKAMRGIIDNASGHEQQITMLWAAIEKLGGGAPPDKK